MCRWKSGNRSSATTLTRGGGAKIVPPKEKTRSHTVLCYSQSSQNTKYPDHPRLRAGGHRQDEENNRKDDSRVPQFSGPITQTTARHFPYHSPALSGGG